LAHVLRHKAIMKKVLMFAGAVFAFLIVAIVVLIAVAATKGTALDSESKQYSDTAIRAICTTWDESQLIDRAGPEMLKSLPSQTETQQLFAQWRRLGPMTSLDPLQGDANTTMLFGNGIRVTAGYVGIAHFKSGAARIKITLIKRDGAWRLVGFWLYGNLDAGAPGPAVQIVYRTIRSSCNLSPGGIRNPAAFLQVRSKGKDSPQRR
jgi:hypothetical protein